MRLLLDRERQAKNRYFNLNATQNAYHGVLSKYQNARFAVFTDMIENSMLDLIVVSDQDDSKVPTMKYKELWGTTRTMWTNPQEK